MEEQTTQKKGGGKIFLIIVIVAAIFSLIYIIFNRNSLTQNLHFGMKISRNNSPSRARKITASSSGKYIAKLYITGIIQEANETYNQEWLLSTIQDLQCDSQNVGILLVIDSPGGTVYEADEAYLALREYRQSGKLIWAYFESLAASGGYYIGCAAETIYANRNTLTGSIGVIAGTSVDATEFLEKVGIKTATFTAGKNKNMLNYNAPLTEEQALIMQSIADDCYEQFTGIVASARQKSVDQVKTLADGRIYTAKQAKENGLVDAIGSVQEAQDKMLETLAADKNSELEEGYVDFYEFEYEYQAPLFNRFLGIVTGQKKPAAALMDPITKTALETLAPEIKYPAYLYKN